MKPLRVLWISLAWGAALAILLSVTMTVWDWVENPSGIFHGPAGTRWDFVVQTAVSWLIPTFVYGTLGAWLVQIVRAGIKRLWGRRGW